jgi:hypothetical protein
MESAPKDGTHIIFINKYREIDICWWDNSKGWISYHSQEYGTGEDPIYWTNIPEFDIDGVEFE